MIENFLELIVVITASLTHRENFGMGFMETLYKTFKVINIVSLH